MPINQLPVPENPLPQEREVYLLAEIYSEMNFKHVELEGVEPSLPRTLWNFHLIMRGTHVLQQGHFQAKGLPRLETDKITKS